MRKKTLILVIMLLLAISVSGCAKIDYGVLINPDGSGYVYSKNLIAMPEDELGEAEMDDEFFDFDESKLITQRLKETYNGQEYNGALFAQEFDSLEELEKLLGYSFDIVRDGNIVRMYAVNEESEESDEEYGMDEISMLKAMGVEARIKFWLNGEIIKTNGDVSYDENSVTWDILKSAMDDTKEFILEYRENPETEKRTLKSDGFMYENPKPETKPNPQPKPNEVSVIINGKRIEFPDQKPVIKNGRTLVPVRVISENLDTDIEWIPDKTVKITKMKNGITTNMHIVINSNQVLIESYNHLDDIGTSYMINLDVPAEIINGRTMVPLRAISELFDIDRKSVV